MTILDNFETAPIQQYTGSYTDDVYVGNINQISSNLSGGFTRQRIASAATDEISSDIFNRKNLTYNQRLQIISGAQMPGISSVKFSQGFSITEKFLDSFVVNPVEIAKANGVTFPYLADSGSLQGSPLHNIPGAVNNSVSLFLSNKSIFTVSQSSTALGDFVDQDWSTAKWPFRRKYRALNKIFKPSTKLPSFVEQTKNFAGTTITPASKSNNLGSVYYVSDNKIEMFFPYIFSILSSSTDGITFQNIPVVGTGSLSSTTLPFFNSLEGCLAPSAGDNQPIILGAGRTIYKSIENGIVWENITPINFTALLTPTINGIAYSTLQNGNFSTWAAAGNTGTTGMVLTNTNRNPGKDNWIIRATSSFPLTAFHDIAFNDPKGEISSSNFAIVGETFTTSLVVTSSDRNGTDWFEVTAKPSTVTILRTISFCSASQKFLTAGDGVIWQSDDNVGSSWTEVLSGSDLFFKKIATNDSNTIICIGNNGIANNFIYRSSDGGATWSSVFTIVGLNGTFTDVTAGRTEDNFDWIVCTSEDVHSFDPRILIISRDDGVTWQTNTNNPLTSLNAIAPSNTPLNLIIGTAFNSQTKTFDSLPKYFSYSRNVSSNRNVIFRVTNYASNAYYTGSNGNLIHEIVSLEKGGAKPGKLLDLTTIATDINELYKAYYGIGDGISINFSDQGPLLDNNSSTPQSQLYLKNRSVGAIDHTIYNPTTLQGSIESVRLHGIKLRGWGYGLYNALPTSTKVIWRRGKYGQFRDMLEQRLYSKMFNTKFDFAGSAGPIQSPVFVFFTSGSNAARLFISQSNTNPTDSGQFDYECKAAQPFFDDIDLTAFRDTY